MLDQILLMLLSVFPGLGICYYIYWRDKYEPEPKKWLFWCFVFGMFSTYPAIKMEEFGIHELGIRVSDDPWMTFSFAFAVVAFSEELVKFLFLRYFIYPRREFDEPMDGIVYAVMISMGFATFENVLYVVFRDGGYQVAFLRMCTAVPAHAAFAVWMGYYAGLAKFSKRPAPRLLLGLFGAIILHGFYDFFLFLHQAPALIVFTFITLGGSIFLAKRLIKKHVDDSPFLSTNDESETRDSIS